MPEIILTDCLGNNYKCSSFDINERNSLSSLGILYNAVYKTEKYWFKKRNRRLFLGFITFSNNFKNAEFLYHGRGNKDLAIKFCNKLIEKFNIDIILTKTSENSKWERFYSDYRD